MYGQMFDLIYDCSSNRVAAKALVDRILEKIVVGKGSNGILTEKPKKQRRKKRDAASARKPRRSSRRKVRSR
jgi:hypothetical protein